MKTVMNYLKFSQKLHIIVSALNNNSFSGEVLMNGLTGMEKFSHLEDKIYLTIEFAKKLREEKEGLERTSAEMRRETERLASENARLEEKVEKLLSERDAIQLKVEAMLEAMALIDAEVAEAVGR